MIKKIQLTPEEEEKLSTLSSKDQQEYLDLIACEREAEAVSTLPWKELRKLYYITPMDEIEKNTERVFSYFKKLEFWTLSEGIFLLTEPLAVAPTAPELFNKYGAGQLLIETENIRIFDRGIQAAILKVFGERNKTPDSIYNEVHNPWLKYPGRTLKVNPFHFLEFVKEKDLYKIPPALEYRKEYTQSGEVKYSWVSDPLGETIKKEKKLRSDQKDKIACQKIAKKVWDKYPILDIKHLKYHPDIEIKEFKCYEKKTIHRWLSEVAPDRAKEKGRRDKETKEKQISICEKLGIKI